MAATANVELALAGGRKVAVEVVDAEVMYAGAYAAMGSVHHGTSANRGRVQAAADDTPGLIPLGHVDQQKTGDTDLATGAPEASINVEGRIARGLTITDDAGDITDQGRWVYLTDDNTLSLSRATTTSILVGMTVRFVAADTFDVYFFSLGELLAIAAAGGNRRTWCIGSVHAFGATGNFMTGIVSPFHGKITAFYAICVQDPADADVDIDLNLEIGGTNVTGGVVTLAAADTLGTKKSGTAITAANVIHEGDLIDVEATTNTAGTAQDGLYNLFLDVELLPGV